jgi:murein DD-endopeptidase MepM/ murein hydrolase activator NlpD
MNKTGWLISSTLVTLSLFTFLSIITSYSEKNKESISKPIVLALAEKQTLSQTVPPSAKKITKNHHVKLGDSFFTIFKALSIPYQTLVNLQRAKNNTDFFRLRPKDTITFTYENDVLISIEKTHSVETKLKYTLANQTITQFNIHADIETRIVFSQGIVSDSLYYAGLNNGLNNNLIMNLIQIFSWDIDFNQDIRKGDQFRLIYEQKYSDGVFLKNGRILVAQYINKGKSFQAILFSKHNESIGYYSIDGSPLKKSFLRSPITFSRISSRFTLGRYHPILHKMRAHRGVDYAASRGTPIKTVGNGRVYHKIYSKGFGRYVIIKHANGISTLYAHMSSFRRGLKKGQKVKQGDIIGYVGQSGLATGPHLHYEFRINGKHQNPLKVRLPKAIKLNTANLKLFKTQAKPLLLQFNALKYSVSTTD